MKGTSKTRLRSEEVNPTRWGWYSVGVSGALILINLTIATASGSLAVSAEVVHNIADLLTAIAILIGLKLSLRKSETFPYGLYKLENVIAVLLAVMIFFTAFEIARDAILEPSRDAIVKPWMLGGVALAFIIPVIFGRFELRAGKEVNSPALIADAKEYSVHALTASVVFVALTGQWVGLPLDRIAALVIVVAIVKMGWNLLADGMRVLLDASLDHDTLFKIREIIQGEPSVAEIEWVTGRNAGRFKFVESAIKLRIHELERAESITRHIEERISDAVPFVDRVLIHAEPVERKSMRCAIPLSDREGKVSDHFGEAHFFALVTLRLTDGTVEEEVIVMNPHRKVEKAKGIKVSEWLVEQKVDLVLLKESLKGKGPTYVFEGAGVEIRETSAKNLDEAINELLKVE